jgi:capsular exopolysaccharide synthesis family protein
MIKEDNYRSLSYSSPMAFEDRPVASGTREQPSLRRYLEVLRQRWWLVLAAVALTTGAAIGYVATADEVYETSADMLVTPVSDENPAYVGLGLIRRASDPTRDVTTAARLIENPDVAARVARELGQPARSAPALLNRVSVEPVAQSNIVSITAQGSSPAEARNLANAFGEATVAERTEQLHQQIDPIIEQLEERIDALPTPAAGAGEPPGSEALTTQLAALQQLRANNDPTLSLVTPAALPRSPSSPRTRLSIVGGMLAGLLLGVVGAFALNVLDPRVPREEQLRALGLSVLARVPRRTRSQQSRHAFDEAFRFLRTMIRFASPDESLRTIAVTSASEKEGKTTTAFQLAMAALEAGQRVLLVEADAYRPALWRMLDIVDERDARTGPGLLDYLSGAASLEDVIKPTAVPGLSFVPAGPPRDGSITGLLERERGRAFVDELASYADLVILDCPPVGPRADAVLLAATADAVVFVVDLQHSSERVVDDAVRRLRSAGGNLIGAVINRDSEASSAAYYYGGERARNGAGGSHGRETAAVPSGARQH